MADPKMVFSDNFKRYMDEMGVDQVDIARALDVSTSTVSDWATGKKYPRHDAMQRIAEYLGVLISDSL
ncbi:MAG TPA: helix-turn-helix transcriptional regulator [Syntrophales bacterium]|nr:helix-turn-helix transcriptional regulator [Syntrophales bacterium]